MLAVAVAVQAVPRLPQGPLVVVMVAALVLSMASRHLLILAQAAVAD